MRCHRGYLLKAIVIREFCGPEVLRWEKVSIPRPGPDEVLVRVHAVSFNHTLDLQVCQDGGDYGTVLPLVLGNDPSGVVVSGLGAECREDLERALQLGSSGEIHVLIDQVLPLREAAAAHRLMATNESVGKIVLDPTFE